MNEKDLIGIAFVVLGFGAAALAWSTLFLPDRTALKVLEALAAASFTVIGGVVGWIGVQLLKTPPPKPAEELERELREEIEKIRREILEKLKDSTQG